MNENKNHMPSILVLVALAFGALSLMGFSAIMLLSSLIGLLDGSQDPVNGMIGAFTFGFECVLALVCFWFVLQKTRGLSVADLPFQIPFAWWQFVLVFLLLPPSIAVGAAVSFSEIQWLGIVLLPALTLIVVAPPAWLLTGLGINGIDLGPRWRAFAVFGIGMTLAPFLIVIVEIIALIFLLIIAVFALAAQPELLQEISQLADLFQNTTDQDAIISALAPYIQNPFLIASAFGYIAVFVPIVEEALKPLAVWVLGKKLESNAQGFALGALSGAAFGVVESLNASADGSSTWAFLVTARAGTTMLHILASGLVGWGIARAFREKKFGGFLGAYFSAVLIHGIWNACALGAGIAGIGGVIGKPEWLFTYAPAALCGLATLFVGVFAVLIAANRKMKEERARMNEEERALIIEG